MCCVALQAVSVFRDNNGASMHAGQAEYQKLGAIKQNLETEWKIPPTEKWRLNHLEHYMFLVLVVVRILGMKLTDIA